MNKHTRRKIYSQAVDKWGLEPQTRQLMEECAELIQATNKFLNKDSPENVAKFVEEIVDVEIMLEQVKMIYSWWLLEEKVDKYKESKLLELKSRVQL